MKRTRSRFQQRRYYICSIAKAMPDKLVARSVLSFGLSFRNLPRVVVVFISRVRCTKSKRPRCKFRIKVASVRFLSVTQTYLTFSVFIIMNQIRLRYIRTKVMCACQKLYSLLYVKPALHFYCQTQNILVLLYCIYVY